MSEQEDDLGLAKLVEQSMQIRKTYHELETQNHGTPWSPQEDMVGFVYDVGELGRMIMAKEGRWVYPGDLQQDLQDKLAECLWWTLVLSGRLGVDIPSAFAAKMAELENSLSPAVKDGDQKAEP